MRERGLIVLLAALVLPGCTVVQSAQWAVARYCALPADARAVNREALALALAPNRLTVECAQ